MSFDKNFADHCDYDSFIFSHANIRSENNELKKSHDSLMAEHEELKRKYDTLQKNHDILTKTLEKKNTSLDVDNNSSHLDYEKIVDDLCAHKKKYDFLKEENDIMEENYYALRNEHQDVKNAYHTVKEKYDYLYKKVLILDNRCSSYKFSRDSLKKERIALRQNSNSVKKDRDACKKSIVLMKKLYSSVSSSSSSSDKSIISHDVKLNDRLRRIIDLQTDRGQNQQIIIDELANKYNEVMNIMIDKHKHHEKDTKILVDQTRILKTIISNLVNFSKIKIMTPFACNDANLNNLNQQMCVCIPKVIKLLTRGGIIHPDDVLKLTEDISKYATSLGVIKGRAASFQGEIEFSSLRFGSESLDVIVEMCVDWINKDKNLSRLVYDIIE